MAVCYLVADLLDADPLAAPGLGPDDGVDAREAFAEARETLGPHATVRANRVSKGAVQLRLGVDGR
ncbi:MAG: hypothetical protein ACYDB7_03480 [Mycobacteriales bacterium]